MRLFDFEGIVGVHLIEDDMMPEFECIFTVMNGYAQISALLLTPIALSYGVIFS